METNVFHCTGKAKQCYSVQLVILYNKFVDIAFVVAVNKRFVSTRKITVCGWLKLNVFENVIFSRSTQHIEQERCLPFFSFFIGYM